ncbi:MAG: histidine kinase [Chitinophagaceae bacterium]
MENSNSLVLPFNNPLIRFISASKYRWLRHTLFILFGLILAFKGDIGTADQFPSYEAWRVVIFTDCITFVFIMAMIYLMLLVLIPRLLFRSKMLLFALSFVILVSLIYIMVWFLDLYFLRDLISDKRVHIELSLLHYIQIGAISSVLLASVVGMKVFKKWIIDVQQMHELKETNLKTELEQLKSQVNPHFLFNTLNNLHVLTKTDPEKASQVILGLSDLLRYQLYDSAREKILLSKDIAFIHNLLSMEKLRKDDFTYEVHSEGRTDGISLPPFLFIPFVENAIKHGASTTGHSYLKLNFRITPEQIYFYSENSKPVSRNNSIGGIGLKNIKRRLELLYPDNHTLEIKEDAEKYIVTLTLPL